MNYRPLFLLFALILSAITFVVLAAWRRPARLLVLLTAFSLSASAQNWSGVLNAVPSNGTAACVGCAVDWTTAGVQGGIPSGSWTQSGSTISATGSDQTSQIQTALNACGTNHFVLLAAGTFVLTGSLSIPSNCVLRGSGANQTIISNQYTGGNAFLAIGDFSTFGSLGFPTAGVAITGGNTAGSTSISVASTSGLTVGNLLIITQVNDGTIVNANGTEGNCNYCDQQQTSDGSRAQGQLSLITSCDGGVTTPGHVCSSATSVGISPGLFIQYTHSPTEVPYVPVAHNAGIENLQVYSTSGSNQTPNFQMTDAYNAWVSGVESNYTGANHVDVFFCLHCAVVNSYFSNTYGSGPGSYDHGLRIANKSTLNLIQNNIFERTGVIEMEWGDAANVFAYNFKTGAYSGSASNYFPADIESHGAHSQFDLFEGNIVNKVQMDSIHGSTSNDTFFRDWIRGANITCNPITGVRGTVSCSGTNGWWDTQSVIGNSIDFLSTYQNFVGQVEGATDMNALTYANSGSSVLAHVDLINYTTTRSYDASAYGFTFGFGNTGDDGTGGLTNGAGCTDAGLPYPCHSGTPLSSSFQHGVHYMFDGTTTWQSGVTHTLPASFYLPSQPSWWVFPSGTASPWPGIGPDVTGGLSQANGLAYLNPAANCFYNVMGGTLGGQGGPLPFSAAKCYPSGSGVTSQLGSPINLTATIN